MELQGNIIQQTFYNKQVLTPSVLPNGYWR